MDEIKRNAFERANNKVCPICGYRSLKIVSNGNRSKPVYEKFKCIKCKNEFNIDWGNSKYPMPIYGSYKSMLIMNKVNKYYI